MADGRTASRDVLHDGRQLVECEGVRPAELDLAVPEAFASEDALDQGGHVDYRHVVRWVVATPEYLDPALCL